VELKRPEIKKAEWKDKDDGSTSKGLVGELLKLCAETKDVEAGVTFTVYNKATGEEVTSIGAEVEGDKAEAEWYASDPREKDDRNELKYYFLVTANRAKECKSSDIQVKNPRVVSMAWDKKAAFWGEEVELTINTFEMDDLQPDCTVNIWEEEIENPDKLILSSDITLDKEEVKIKLTIDFSLKDVSKFDFDDDYRLYAVISIDKLGKYFRQQKENYILISNDI